jgi:hypothetical protein
MGVRMEIKEFAFKAPINARDEKLIVILVCDNCGERECRPIFFKLTGHLHDQKCTYVCRTCRGTMREEVNPKQDDEEN